MNERLPRYTQSHIVRLAFVFLSIIMAMSVGFSTIIYVTASSELDSQLPINNTYTDQDGIFGPSQRLQQYLQTHVSEGKQTILLRLAVLNSLVFLLGGVFSFLMARRMLQPIEDAMEAQAQFVSDASHVLRTPLTAIQTTNEVTLRKPKLTIKEARTVLTSNLEDVERLQRMTSLLLDLANLDLNLQLSRTNIHDIISRAMTDVAPQAVKKGISINDKTTKAFLLVDPDAAAQALTVLLDNAVKYSPKHSIIELGSSSSRHFVRIDVTDHGTGISDTERNKVFDRFYRSDNARSRQAHDGYGLGLAIAKQIAESHGGTINVRSSFGEGSTFSLELPIAR